MSFSLMNCTSSDLSEIHHVPAGLFHPAGITDDLSGIQETLMFILRSRRRRESLGDAALN